MVGVAGFEPIEQILHQASVIPILLQIELEKLTNMQVNEH